MGNSDIFTHPIKDKVNIYLEDYVKSFLYIISHELDRENEGVLPFRLFPLYGSFVRLENEENVYIQGAAAVKSGKLQGSKGQYTLKLSEAANNTPETHDVTEQDALALQATAEHNLYTEGSYNQMKETVKELGRIHFPTLEPVGVCIISNDRSGYIDLSALIDITDAILGEGRGIILIKDRNSATIRPFACLPDGIRELDRYMVYYSQNCAMQKYMQEFMDRKAEIKCEPVVKQVEEEKPDESEKPAPAPSDISLRGIIYICMILGIIAGTLILYYIENYNYSSMELRTSLRQFTNYRLGR